MVALSFVQTAADFDRRAQLMAAPARRGRAARRQARTSAGARASRRDPGGCDGGHGRARRSRARDAARARAPRAERHHAPARACRHPGDPRHAGARVDDAPSRGRRAPRSATPPTRWTTAWTRSCWRAKPPPARFPREPSRRSTRSSARPNPVPTPAAADVARHDVRRRSHAGHLRSGSHAGQPERRARDCRRHARRQHREEAVRIAPARADRGGV